jgi:hypothetical protein
MQPVKFFQILRNVRLGVCIALIIGLLFHVPFLTNIAFLVYLVTFLMSTEKLEGMVLSAHEKENSETQEDK